MFKDNIIFCSPNYQSVNFFLPEEVSFLGHVISKGGIMVNFWKVEQILFGLY